MRTTTAKRVQLLVLASLASTCGNTNGDEIKVSVEQITHGPKHHMFGYVGQSLTIPWNEDGQFIVGLRIGFRNRMPRPGETADVILIDTKNKYAVQAVDQTRAWNLQQGTMLYWNPAAPRTQFMFNDLDLKTGQVFAVLYDIEKRKRVREYRYDDVPVGNGNVAPNGKWFVGLNYGKITCSREVISYPGARDYLLKGQANPDNDGLFRIDLKTGKRKLLVSYQKLAAFLQLKDADTYPIYVHHTLWNRDSDRIHFVVRGKGDMRPNAWCIIHADGTGLKRTRGDGHPEWGEGKSLVLPAAKLRGAFDLYDVDREKVVGQIGKPGTFPRPAHDNAMSPDARWHASGYMKKGEGYAYVIYRRADGGLVHTRGFGTGGSGSTRIDPAPRWNRTSNALLVPGVDRKDNTRQLYMVRIR